MKGSKALVVHIIIKGWMCMIARVSLLAHCKCNVGWGNLLPQFSGLWWLEIVLRETLHLPFLALRRQTVHQQLKLIIIMLIYSIFTDRHNSFTMPTLASQVVLGFSVFFFSALLYDADEKLSHAALAKFLYLAPRTRAWPRTETLGCWERLLSEGKWRIMSIRSTPCVAWATSDSAVFRYPCMLQIWRITSVFFFDHLTLCFDLCFSEITNDKRAHVPVLKINGTQTSFKQLFQNFSSFILVPVYLC